MDHIYLLIQYRDGEPQCEPVHAELVGDNVYRLRFSPGFVLGIAAGDEFTLEGEDGAFKVTKRGGNLAIQVFSTTSIDPLLRELDVLAESLGGTLDGNIERGAVLTIPVAAGFAKVEGALSSFCERHPELKWYYGNVYAADGTTPLRWWEDGA